MRACDGPCGGKGYVETFYHYGNDARPCLQQCTKCRDTAAYSKRVQELYAEDSDAEDFPDPTPMIERRREPCPVIPFRRP